MPHAFGLILLALVLTTCVNPVWLEYSRYSAPAALRPVSFDSDLQWNMEMINAPGAWGILKQQADNGRTIHPVVVAVLDTGVQADHPALQDRVIGEHSESFADAPNPLVDPNGHGTHIAGVVATVPHGMEPLFGTASGAEDAPVMLLAVKVLSDSGGGYTSWVTNGIDHVTGLRTSGDLAAVRVINLSLGDPTAADPQLLEAIRRARRAGITVVAAAGNNGSEAVFFPAAFSEVLGVGALDASGLRAAFSQYGRGLDQMAPGVEIRSTFPVSGYATGSGTSQATPHVAGIAALLYALEPGLNQDAVYSILRATANDLGAPGWDKYYGHGLVDAQAALEYLVNLERRVPRAPMGAGDIGSRGVSIQTEALSGPQYPEPDADIDAQSLIIRFHDGKAPQTEEQTRDLERELQLEFGIVSARRLGEHSMVVQLAPGQDVLALLAPLGGLDAVQYSQPNYRYQAIR